MRDMRGYIQAYEGIRVFDGTFDVVMIYLLWVRERSPVVVKGYEGKRDE